LIDFALSADTSSGPVIIQLCVDPINVHTRPVQALIMGIVSGWGARITHVEKSFFFGRMGSPRVLTRTAEGDQANRR
jgi:hypothetical protein